QAAQAFARFVDGLAKHDTVRPGKINVLENAKLIFLLWREADRFQSAARNADHFARFHVAHVFGVDQIERAGFRSRDPRAIEPPNRQRPEAAWIANRKNFVGGQKRQQYAPPTL